MPISRFKKFRNWFFFLLIMGGFPLLIWAGYSVTAETYAFWKHGVAKPAEVIALDHTGGSSRGGTIYYYELEIDETRIVEGFRVKLPVGKSVSVLTLPNKPKDIVLGTEDSSWFDIYAYGIGGKVMGVLTLAVFGFMIACGPWAFVTFLKGRRAFLDQD